MKEKKSLRKRGVAGLLPKIIFWVLILWAAFWLVWNAVTFSVTSDEIVYGPVGLRMLKKGDMIMNNEHPPLNKILAGLSLIPANMNLEKAYTTVTDNDQWKFGDTFLFESGNSTSLAMFLSRLPTILLTLLMLVSVWLWVGGYLGLWAGAGAVASLALNPNILANGALSTNDMHLTVSVWLLFVATYNLIKNPKLSRYIWFGLAIGLVLIAKFNGVFFIGIAAIVALVGLVVKKLGYKKILSAVALSLVVALAVVWVSYVAIEWRGILGHRTLQVSVPTQGSVNISNRLVKITVVPFLRYKEGYNAVALHNALGHNAYLNGKFSMQGFRSFFTYAIWYKTPTALLFLAVLGFILAAIKKQRVVLGLALVGIIMVTAANYSHIHIGIRHVLPVYVLFAPLVGFVISQLILNKNKYISAILVLLVIWWGIDLGLNSPNKISFFSQISGGWREGYKHLSDSNTDWGQELQVLINWIKNNPDRKLIIGYATGENPIYRGIKYTRITELGTRAICDGLQKDETLLVSVNVATGLFGPYPCISDKIEKADRLGHTYLVLQPDDFK